MINCSSSLKKNYSLRYECWHWNKNLAVKSFSVYKTCILSIVCTFPEIIQKACYHLIFHWQDPQHFPKLLTIKSLLCYILKAVQVRFLHHENGNCNTNKHQTNVVQTDGIICLNFELLECTIAAWFMVLLPAAPYLSAGYCWVK